MEELLSYIFEDEIKDNNFRYKKMFGSYGIYYKEKFIGIFSDGEFYIKKGTNKLSIFENNGDIKFSYMRKGKLCYLKNYLKINEYYIDSPSLLREILINSYL